MEKDGRQGGWMEEGWRDSEASPPAAAAACGGALTGCPGTVNLLYLALLGAKRRTPEDFLSVTGDWEEASFKVVKATVVFPCLVGRLHFLVSLTLFTLTY